jgi:hypothetical protein
MTEDLMTVLRGLEERLLTPEVRGSRAAAGALIGDDFLEFGSSGSVYDKAAILAGLEEERDDGIAVERQTSHWIIRELGPDTALITYRVRRREVPDGSWEASLRSSIWRRAGASWEMVFHQGTNIRTSDGG